MTDHTTRGELEHGFDPDPDVVEARKFHLDFDEVSGRTTPPDIVDAVLHAASLQRGGRRGASRLAANRTRDRRAPLLAAALIFLAVSITAGIGWLAQRDATLAVNPAAVSPAAVSPAAETVRSGQEKVQEKTSRAKSDKTKQQDKNKKKTSKKSAEQTENETVDVATQRAKKTAEQLAEHDLLLTGLLEREKRKNPLADPVRGNNPNDRVADLTTRIDQLRALVGSKDEFPFTKNSLLKGDYRKAIQKISDLRNRLIRTEDPKAARKLIDAMTVELGNARGALWRLEQQKKKGPATKKKIGN